MGTCGWCKHEMLDKISCTGNLVVPFEDGKLPSVPNGDKACRDCGCPPGGRHHPGCDNELCPKYDWQLISCGCEVLDEEVDSIPEPSHNKPDQRADD